METKVRNPKMNRLRRILWLVPLLLLTLGTLLFWAFDNGLSKEEEEERERRKRNLAYLTVPESLVGDDTLLDKMSYYEMADRDSIKFQELARNDPYYEDALPAEEYRKAEFSVFDKKGGKTSLYGGGLNENALHYKNRTLSDPQYRSEKEESIPPRKKKSGMKTSFYGKSNDSNTDKIYRKLEELNREINKPVPTSKKEKQDAYQIQEGNSTTVDSPEVEKLEKMMQAMNQPSGEDPELKQLSAMLDKILDMQYPERAQEKFKKDSEANRGKVFAVSSQKKDNALSTSKTVTAEGTNGFYSLTESSSVEDSQNAIKAVIHQTQTVVNGSTVKLRLVNDVFINGVRIPKDNFLYGIAALNGERLSIKINSVRYNNSLFPVELSVYDMDGLDGIYIPGAITREVARQSADRTMQTIGLTSLDSSLGLQAAGAGIEAAKSLLSQKVKQIKVTVKAGYQVLLQDEKQTQSS